MPRTQSKPSLFGNDPRKRPLGVLILDDERFDRHRIARLCSRLDFPCDVTNAKTMAEFATHLDQNNFDLILLDFVLPDGTGLDALHLVHLSAQNLNTPTLMISGQAKSDIAQQVITAGCSGFLTKDDLNFDDFTTAVEQALGPKTADLCPRKQSYDAVDVRLLLERSTNRCAGDVKPMISRIMRQMRDLRAQNTTNNSADLIAVEQNCLSLWSFLVEMERQDGADLLTELAPAIPSTIPEMKSTRPPSPFTAQL